jgi:tripartite-type tricarboxylate transporter receptor subunit TctC
MLTKRSFLSSIAGLALGGPTINLAFAGAYPARPITIIVPFPAGGNLDVIGRFIADRLSPSLGQPVIIDHRPGGAGGSVGATAVARAEPDGQTLLLSSPAALVVAPAIYRNLQYDPATAFTPIASLSSSPQMLVVNPRVPARSFQEFLAYAKANPGKINFASPGYGTQPHLLGEMFRLATGVNIVHVPYKGTAQAITDLLAGEVQMYFETVSLLLPHVQAEKLRALAVADETRCPQLPEVPTTTESGFPQLQATYWSGVVAPAGTPANIISKLNSAINEILKTPELRANLAQLDAKPKIGSPEEFTAFLAAERQKWTEVASAAGIRAD